MSRQRPARRPAVSLIAGRVGGAVFATAWMVVAARSLDAAAFGRLAVVISIGTVAAVVAEGGYPVLVADAAATTPERARSVVRGALRVRLPLALLAVIATVVGGFVAGGSLGAATGAAYGIWIVASAVQTTLGSALRGVGHVNAEAVGELASRGLALVVGVPLLAVWASPVIVTLAYAAGVVAAAVGLAVAFARATSHEVGADPWTVPVRRTATLGLVAVLATLYNRVDLWVLAAMATSHDAGVYAASYRLYEGLVLPAAAFGALLVPAAARRPEKARASVERHVLAAVLLTGAASLVMLAAAPQVVLRLFGSDYAAAVGPMRLLAVAAIPAAALSAVAPLTSLTVRGSGTHLYLVGIVVTTVGNLALVPAWGPVGSAVAMVVSQSALAVLFLRSTFRSLDRPAVGARAGRRRAGSRLPGGSRPSPVRPVPARLP